MNRTERMPLPGVIAALAGPVLIVALVIVVLHDVAFGGMLSGRNPDLLAFWMPNQCLLSQELTAGRIPYWNPYALAGTPFAADPQSGWMYLPMMALSLVGCDVALRGLVLLFPILAGLGAYAFLRAEGAARSASTLAGLALAGTAAGSALAVTLTFVGFIAWSPWLLAAASRALQARSWSARLGWAAAAALVWGQLAAAHISNGLVMGSVLLVAFWVYKAVREKRDGRSTLRVAVLLGVVFIVFFVALNLAYLLPRLIYLQRSTIGLGYEGLFSLRNELWDLGPVTPPLVRVTEPVWILRLATSPGAYLGALPLALCFAGFFSGRWRALTGVLWAYVALFFLVGTSQVASVLQPLIGDTFVGDFYGHAPARFGYAPILGLCLLAGVGFDAWRAERSGATRVAMVMPGLLLWGVVPLAAGAVPARMALAAAGAAVALPLLFLAARWKPALVVVVVVLAVELGLNGLYGQSGTWEADDHGLTDPRIVGVQPLPEPDVDAAAFVSNPPPVLAGLEPPRERWLTLQPPLYLLGRQIVHGLHEAQGYNPVQLRRYWIYTRAVERRGVDPRPRMTIFRDLPPPDALDLLHVRYVAVDSAAELGGGFTKAADGEGWHVWEVDAASPPASVHSFYPSPPSADDALRAVTDPSFDPRRELVVERVHPNAGAGTPAPALPAELVWRDASSFEVRLPEAWEPDDAAFLLARVPYDDYWSAEVGGSPRDVKPANYFLQGVEVSEEDRVVRFRYRDPWVLRSLWGSAIALATVALVCIATSRRRRARGETASRETNTSEDGT